MSKHGSSSEFQYYKVPSHENTKQIDKVDVPATYGFGIRHVQLVLVFLSLVVCFVARSHLGVTLVAMTSQENITEVKEIETHIENNYTSSNLTEDYNYIGEDYQDYDLKLTELDNFLSVSNRTSEKGENWSVYKTYIWGKPVQEMVLNSFFLGYCLMMLPIALVCQRWGGKVPLQLALLVNGVVSILTPWLALWGGWQALCLCRVLQGLSQAGCFPGVQTLLSQWVPAKEKATLASYVYTGATAGSVIGFQIGGLLSHSCGWPAAFWAVGVLCLLTFALLTVLGAASPKVHKTISDEEKNYIIGDSVIPVVKTTRLPWKAMATSKPLLGNLATVMGSGISFVFFFTQVPSYLHYICGIDVKSSGVLSSLPYITSIFASLAFGVTSDYLTNHKIVSVKNARRISNSLSQVGVAVALIGASYSTSTAVAVFWFIVFMVSHMGIHTGWMVNQIDLAPNYSGPMIAIGSMLVSLLVLLVPVVTSYVIVDMHNVSQWRIMLYLEAAIAFIPNLIFVRFISADVQPWNEVITSETEKKDAKLETLEKNEEKK